MSVGFKPRSAKRLISIARMLAAGIDQHDAVMCAQRDHRTPAQPAMAHRLAGKALHYNVDIVIVDLHDVPKLRGEFDSGSGGSPALAASSCSPAISLLL